MMSTSPSSNDNGKYIRPSCGPEPPGEVRSHFRIRPLLQLLPEVANKHSKISRSTDH